MRETDNELIKKINALEVLTQALISVLEKEGIILKEDIKKEIESLKDVK